MEESEPEKITHIDLAQSTDLFLVAPASANIIGKLASGTTDDLLTSVAVALHSNTPKILAPAMNSCMYENSIVQRNLALLKENGFQEIQPRESILSSGSFGKGALAEVSDIVGVVENTLK